MAQRNGKFNPKPDAPPHHLIMGLELSGVVDAVGEGVVDLEVGMRVCALVYGGGYSYWAVAPQEQVLVLPIRIPAGDLTWLRCWYYHRGSHWLRCDKSLDLLNNGWGCRAQPSLRTIGLCGRMSSRPSSGICSITARACWCMEVRRPTLPWLAHRNGVPPCAGAGGIGSTVITLAKLFGKTVYTTVSSDQKAAAVKK